VGILVLTLAFAACKESAAAPKPEEPPPEIYTSTDGEGHTYELTITKGSGRAAIGDNYELKVINVNDNTDKTSKGKVTGVSESGEFTLTPSNSTKKVTITIEDGSMTAIEGEIIDTNGKTIINIETKKQLSLAYFTGGFWVSKYKDDECNILYGTSTLPAHDENHLYYLSETSKAAFDTKIGKLKRYDLERRKGFSFSEVKEALETGSLWEGVDTQRIFLGCFPDHATEILDKLKTNGCVVVTADHPEYAEDFVFLFYAFKE